MLRPYSATVRERSSTSVVSGVETPIYYPGTALRSEAEVVRIAAGQEVSGMVFSMVASGAATVGGTIRSPDGNPVAGASVTG